MPPTHLPVPADAPLVVVFDADDGAAVAIAKANALASQTYYGVYRGGLSADPLVLPEGLAPEATVEVDGWGGPPTGVPDTHRLVYNPTDPDPVADLVASPTATGATVAFTPVPAADVQLHAVSVADEAADGGPGVYDPALGALQDVPAGNGAATVTVPDPEGTAVALYHRTRATFDGAAYYSAWTRTTFTTEDTSAAVTAYDFEDVGGGHYRVVLDALVYDALVPSPVGGHDWTVVNDAGIGDHLHSPHQPDYAGGGEDAVARALYDVRLPAGMAGKDLYIWTFGASALANTANRRVQHVWASAGANAGASAGQSDLSQSGAAAWTASNVVPAVTGVGAGVRRYVLRAVKPRVRVQQVLLTTDPAYVPSGLQTVSPRTTS